MTLPSSNLMKIGDLASKAGVTLRTVRYYHELGLLVPSERSTGNFRLYEESSLDVIKLISNLKNLGFSLKQIQELLVEPESDAANANRVSSLMKIRKILLAEKDKLKEKMKKYEELSKEIDDSLYILNTCFECRKSIGSAAPCKPGCSNTEVISKFNNA